MILAMPAIEAMQLEKHEHLDNLRTQLVRAYKGGAYGNTFDAVVGSITPSDLTALCRHISAPVLAAVTRIEQQQTDASLADLNETLALLRVLLKNLDDNYLKYIVAQSRVQAIKDRKLALLKEAAGPTDEDEQRRLWLEKKRLAVEASCAALRLRIVEAYQNDDQKLRVLLGGLRPDVLSNLCRRIAAEVLEKAVILEQKELDANINDLDEVLALLCALIKNMDEKYHHYISVQMTLNAIKNQKLCIIKAGAGPTVAELAKIRSAQHEAEAREVEKIARYTTLRQLLFATWKDSERDKRDCVSRVVQKFFAQKAQDGSCMIIVYPEPIWEFLDWLLTDAFEKAQAVLEKPEAATVEQITEALILLAAFFKQAHTHEVTSNSLYLRLATLHWNRTRDRI